MESSASSAVPAVAVYSTSAVHQSEDVMDIDVHEESKDDHAPILAIILSRSTASARRRRTGEEQPSAPVPTTAAAINVPIPATAAPVSITLDPAEVEDAYCSCGEATVEGGRRRD